jgi:RimJ/RimL family protein N-acetyltransferase
MTYVPATYPVLETERLILRGPAPEDFAEAAKFMASPRSSFVGGPVTEEWQNWRGFISVFGHWAMRGFGFFTVTRKDKSIIGRAGIIHHIDWQEPELGWQIYDGFEGKGYAFEAAASIREWAATNLGLTGLISYIDPANTRSIKLAERLGAVYETDGALRGHPCRIYRHPKIEVSL